MTDRDDNINLGKIALDDNNQENFLGLFGTNLFQIADCVSVPTFCPFATNLCLLLKNSPFKNL